LLTDSVIADGDRRDAPVRGMLSSACPSAALSVRVRSGLPQNLAVRGELTEKPRGLQPLSGSDRGDTRAGEIGIYGRISSAVRAVPELDGKSIDAVITVHGHFSDVSGT